MENSITTKLQTYIEKVRENGWVDCFVIFCLNDNYYKFCLRVDSDMKMIGSEITEVTTPEVDDLTALTIEYVRFDN